MCYSHFQTPPSPVASAAIALIYRSDRSISSSSVRVFYHLSHLSNHSALIRIKDRGKCSHEEVHIIGSEWVGLRCVWSESFTTSAERTH